MVPRWLFGLLLVESIAGLVLIIIVTFGQGSEPVALVPPEYWLYSTLGTIFLIGFGISLNYLWQPSRSLAAVFVSLGIIASFSFLLRTIGQGWTGHTTMLFTSGIFFFAVALVLKLRERQSVQAEQS